MRGSFGEKLQSGQTLMGTIVTLGDPQVSELLSSSGFDWLFIDGEHAPLSARDIQGILQAVSHRCLCAVRIPANEEVYIKKALDAVFIGPYDMSASLGRTGALTDPEVVRCIEHVRDCCLAKKVPVGIFTMDAGAVTSLADEGYTLIAAGMDTVMLAASAKRMLDQTRP